MTARTIVEAERHENLEAFEETFAKLEGVTSEHVTELRRASTTTALRSYYPKSDDPLGQAAYTAAAFGCNEREGELKDRFAKTLGSGAAAYL